MSQKEGNIIHLIDRGFTMHQHLDVFNLINMRGRVYDPVVQQFLSPDPYVQMPDNTQNLNRYAYCLNSPTMYVDPSGEKLKWWQWALIGLGVDALTGGAISMTAAATATTGATTLSALGSTVITTTAATAFAASTTLSTVDLPISLGKDIFTSDHQAMQNWWNMEWGRFSPIATMFSYDKEANGLEWVLQIFNNLVNGEFLQDQVGLTLGHALNIGGKIEASGFYKGRLVSRTSNTLNGAISFGHFIYGDNIALDPEDTEHDVELLAHEYGHTYQSRIMGPLYLFRIGIASAKYQGSTEGDADRRSLNNLGIDPQLFPRTTSTYKWYEAIFGSVLWPFMWMWNE